MVTLQNLPEEIKNFVQERGLARSEAFPNEHQVGVQLALTRVTELVMNSFGELAEQPSGREVLWNTAREATTHPGPHGAGLIKSVLDDRYHGTVNGVATAAGVQTATVGRLIDVVTTAALEIMGGLAAEGHWTAQELGQWLRPHPGAGAAAAVAVPLAGLATEPAVARMAADGGSIGWVAANAKALLLALGVIAVGEFGYIIGNRSDTSAGEVAATPSAGTAASPVAGPGAPERSGQYAAVPVANLSAGSAKAAVPVVLKLKNGVRQIIGANSTESKLYQFLIDPSKEVDPTDPTKNWIGFDRIYFESNKAILTNESLWQLSNVASILKRFPDAKVKLGGYTDSSGNPYLNLKLSQERAKAAMTTLVSMGVPAVRLQAVGYGAQDGLASNDTEEGRSLNRRVSLQVVKK
ncbi:OmpA family protein [Hymenobacter caeli]|uniref:Outer membrane protein OmpA-like peptidoglycan-associated protein n=1 Tax=Hymenobacter caeli TaxID=2735894 RepID=A0ABX2FNK5_9BACT|nr:OmpA family protein [Hymenobacter caeli]NRT18750.1 outer membrane protein OmpA-like peptidoglycan-associated protein [Hymenobacter caeli]